MSKIRPVTVNKFDPSVNFSRDSFKAIITPKFYRDFQCIGSDCENHCCHHWRVTVDRETYTKYKKHGDIKVRNIAKKHTKSCGQNAIDYRQIKLEENGDCPFLDVDKLCYLHKNHGEEILPSTCKIYPREDRLIEGELYTGLSISCPEAARKILLDPSAMSFERDLVTSETPLPKFANKLAITNNELQQQFKQMAYNCVLAENSDTVEGRLFNLGFLFRLASQRMEQKQSVSSLLGMFDQLIVAGELNDLYQQAPSAHNVQDFVLQQLLQQFGFNTGNTVFFGFKQQALDQVKASNAYDSEGDNIDLSDFYVRHCQKGYEQLVDSHGYSFINLMLHWIYSTTFDFSDSKELFAQFAQFTLKFFYIRTLCGILQQTTVDDGKTAKEHSEALLVGVIHSISRKSDHDKYFSKLVYASLIQQGLSDPAHILGLIKV